MKSISILPDVNIGNRMHQWAKDLFPVCRSITGAGVRETLKYILNILPELNMHSIPSGTKVFDWTVPDEWEIRDAYIEDETGKRIADFQKHNLHVIGYSEPVNEWLTLEELNPHLYSLPEQPDAIPYITSYYKPHWGFCLTHKQRKTLRPGRYHAVVDSDLKPGVLNYGELILPSKSKEEVLLSTYICHPSMANNELSGPVVTMALAQWLESMENRRYSYRIIFIPETIGSIVYLSRNLEHLRKNLIAGFNITCVGDDRCYSYLPSRDGNTLSDKAALHALKHIDPMFKRYTWLNRGSDERQYCAPGVDLPIATITRSKYGEYPEYHTSLDDLSLVTPTGLEGGFTAIMRAIEVIENNTTPKTKIICEPQLGKREMYPTLSNKSDKDEENKFIANEWKMMHLISYSDGNSTLLEIAELINEPLWKLIPLVEKLVDKNLLSVNIGKEKG